MNKEEILKQAREQKAGAPDEMEWQTMQRGSSFALLTILILAVALMIVKMIAGQPWYDVYCLIFASMGVQHLYKGYKLHQQHEWVLGILFLIVTILFFGGAVWAYLG
jgi:hypothetical protein